MSYIEFKTERLTDRITRIHAVSGEMMYLVEGDKKAALIDTGSGIGSLKPVVERLTDKPVTVLLTHGHVDHAMGAAEFSDVYMSRKDDYIFRDHGSESFREGSFDMVVPPFSADKDDLIPTADLNTFHDLREGDVFDLGGVSVEIYECPGHTKGSLVMLIPEQRVLMTGDACNPFTFMFDYYSTSIEEYEESLKRLVPKVDGKYNRVLLSHGDGEGYCGIIEDVIDVCEDIREQRNLANIPFAFRGKPAGLIAKPADYLGNPEVKPRGNIVYSKDRIRKQKKTIG